MSQHIGNLTIRTIAMPKDTNPLGDVFGGWLVGRMDLAGVVEAQKIAKGRVVTVAIDALSFIRPVHVGDTVCCYTELLEVGNTSMKVKVEVFTIAIGEEERHQVTEGVFTYVAVGEDGRPRPVKK